jgi:hypothetical protein
MTADTAPKAQKATQRPEEALRVPMADLVAATNEPGMTKPGKPIASRTEHRRT